MLGNASRKYWIRSTWTALASTSDKRTSPSHASGAGIAKAELPVRAVNPEIPILKRPTLFFSMQMLPFPLGPVEPNLSLLVTFQSVTHSALIGNLSKRF